MTELFLKVLNLSIGAVPLMAVLLVLRLLFKKAVSRKFFYIAWALVFLRLMVPFSLESDLSIFNFVPKAAVVEENVGTFVVFVENENERVEFPVFINPDNENPNVDWVHHSVITGEIVTGPDITTVPMDKNLILSTVWIFGTGALLLFGIIGYFAVLKKTKFESVEYTKNVRLSEFFKTPVVCGLFRPKIILPMNFDLDDEAKITSVIAHECTHIRRGDNFWRLLASFTLYVHWFNPLVWICYDAFIRDMEVSCDEEVLKKSKNDIRSEYAESLVSLSGKGTNPLYGGVLSFGESAIKERVKCIMNFKRATLLIVIICIAVAAALGVIFLTNPSTPAPNEIVETDCFTIDGEKVAYLYDEKLFLDVMFKNTGDKPLYISFNTEISEYANSRWNVWFNNENYSGGAQLVAPGETSNFFGMIDFSGRTAGMTYDGKLFRIRREVFSDSELKESIGFAEWIFDIETYSGIVAIGEVGTEFVPNHSNMPKEEVFANEEQAKYCEEFIDSIDTERLIQFFAVSGPYDGTYHAEISRENAIKIIHWLQKIELVTCEPKNPNTGGGCSFYIKTMNENIAVHSNGGFFTVWIEGEPQGYAFDAESCSNEFGTMWNIAEEALAEYLVPVEEEEANPQIGYELNAFVSNEFEGGGKYFPSDSVLPNGIEWGNQETAHVFQKFINSLDAGNIKSFMAAFTPAGSGKTVTIGGNRVNELLGLLQKIEIIPGKPKNPTTTGGFAFHIVTNDNDYAVISSDLNALCISIKGQKTNYYFNATDYSDEIWDIMLAMDVMINNDKDIGQVGATTAESHLIPDEVESFATLFSNASKTAAKSYIVDELRDLLIYRNLTINPNETGSSVLGNPLSKVDVIEFIKEDDGSKYTLELYEKGFILKGSAVPEGKLGQQWIVEEDTWEYFKNKINTEFEKADYVIPYWFGLVSPKRVKEVVVFGENGEKYSYTQKDDSFDNFFSIFKNDIKVSSVKERFEGNKLPDTVSKDYIRIKIYFETGTVYEILAEQDYVAMVSSDMSYGLRYNLAVKANAYDAFLDYAKGGPINAVTG